jgi:RimJ/RimL family protein N-acetyltransferase
VAHIKTDIKTVFGLRQICLIIVPYTLNIMSIDKIQNVKIGLFHLQVITEQDKPFIDILFEKTDIKDKYILPIGTYNDYRQLTNYLLKKLNQGTGCAWIIYADKSMPELDPARQLWPIGFFTAEYGNTTKKAQINCALLPACRKQGIMQFVCEEMFSKLKSVGISNVEAYANMVNESASRLAKRLDFEVDTTRTTTKIDMANGGVGLTIQYLWERQL